MSLEQWTAVDRFLTDLLVPHDAALEATLRASDAAGLPRTASLRRKASSCSCWRRCTARGNIAAAGLAHVVEVRVGTALDSLATLEGDDEGSFDLVFIDADKRNNAEYLRSALRLSRPGTVIIADNVVRGGEVVDEKSEDSSTQGVRRFLALLAAEPRIPSTVIQTVGSKGYDGFALGIVTG